jgi:hypothetical protein
VLAKPTGALIELDREETRLTGVVDRLEAELVQARGQLEEVQVARKVFQRINEQGGQPGTPTVSSADIFSAAKVDADTDVGADGELEEEHGDGRPTIKQAALMALKAAYPKGYQKSGIETWIREKLDLTVNYGTLSVMLARLRDDDHAIENHGNAWFFVPENKRQAA